MRLTSSKIALAFKCAWWAREDSPLPPRRESEAASYGTRVHALIEHTVKTRDERPQGDPLHSAWLADWWMLEWHRNWTAEVALGLDLETGDVRAVEGKGREGYADMPEHYLKGTVDAMLVEDEGGERVVRVVDWKTGQQRHTEPAAENPQLALTALAALRLHRADAARVELVKLREGVVIRDEARLEALDLEVFADRMRELVASIPSAEPKPGPHCRTHFCPAFGTTCPATNGAMKRVAPTAMAAVQRPVVFDPALIKDNLHAAELLGLAYATRQALDNLWAALAEYARMRGPIHLAGNRRWGFRPYRSERITSPLPPAAVEALRGALGAAVETALELRTSKDALGVVAAQLARDAKAAGTKATKKGYLDAALEALRAVGALELKTSERQDEWVEGEETEGATHGASGGDTSGTAPLQTTSPA